ncbi:hypothetical protein CAPTEDRAFT_214757 [Capitella teleta]|uniref:Rad21/Rec8-like protein N-terminal domain-containing protein n=1 Tax=Capitella teleta TaxID=283909 RepID=R7UB18_CAPTE|nr:hypothetical protein CAPTEDRAFT_214757 [Capitella teleta]|eukprot:ELU03326.1 hypothetical protein CAPTEDRAFT_214757 [Capitella teleta]
MFFSQDLLQKRGGKFGIIWIAATRGTGLSRRDYIRVNVQKSCDDIIRYLMLQHPASREGLSRPRLSLYLSSQLMYGVVKVYDQQQKILNSDVTNLLTKFHASLVPTLDIDLKAQARREVLASPIIEDCMLADQDFFQMNLNLDEMPNIEYFAIASPGRSAQIGTPSSLEMKSPSFRAEFVVDMGSPLQASKEQITLVESPMPRIIDIQIPGEKDLPPLIEAEASTEDEDPLAKNQEEFGHFLIPTETDMDQGLLPPTEETFGPCPDPEDAIRDPLTKRPPRAESVTPPSSPVPKKRRRRDFQMLLSPPPVTPSPLRRARRLKKLIVDAESQLSKEQQRLNFQHGGATCAPLSYPNMWPSLTELFHEPARKQMQRKAFKRLWVRNTVVRHRSETDSERGEVAWTVPDLGTSSSSSEKDTPPGEQAYLPLLGVSPVRMMDESREEVREASAQASLLVPNESISRSQLDAGTSLNESALPSPQHSLSYLNLSESRNTEEPLLREGSQLMGIPEDIEITPQDLLDPELSGSSSSKDSSPDQLSVWLKFDSSTTDQIGTTFREICPPSSTSKRMAAHTFSALLELCASELISAVQREPFGEIELSRGIKWSQPTPASTYVSP